MNQTNPPTWYATNQHQLMVALAHVRQALEGHAGLTTTTPAPPPPAPADSNAAPSALDTLCQRLDLSPFERNVLLLCAGPELDATFPALCAAAQGDAQRTYPTFGLAQAALPDPHWNAFVPERPLRSWRLVEIGAGPTLMHSPLRIDERVLHYLAGVSVMDERLTSFIEPFRGEMDLVPSQESLSQQIVAVWIQTPHQERWPVVQLCGPDGVSRRGVAAAACARLHRTLHILPAAIIPADPRELETLVRMWMREAILDNSVLLVDCGDADASDMAREQVVTRLIERIQTPLLVAGRERRTATHRAVITLDVPEPTMTEQRMLWWDNLGTARPYLNGGVDAVVAQFRLSPAAIEAACATVLVQAPPDASPDANGQAHLDSVLWEACRRQSRPQIDHLARRIEPRATWDNLVLPAAQVDILREVAAHVRGRMTVYETWGFAGSSSRGLGVSALFVGVSGTGKTMAAEVLANELKLDLYCIDLSQIVNKYIGETEKNLRRVFDAAEGSGAMLLFDEADALFGKRSDVKDSHDRYANIEVSYLLQRMEAYRGLAILTTNMRDALDPAFLRRIRFVVQFPVPDAHQRAHIWGRIFPPAMPTDNLDIEKLARLNIAGGNIRNIAMNAAFLAADAGQPVGMQHLLRAARREYAKLEKHLTDAEVRGWVI